jgi:serine/threonine-protein kinase
MSSSAMSSFSVPLSPEAKELLGRFDSLWQKRERPSIDAFLAECPPDQRLAVLVELVHSELEHRLRAGEAASAEDYLARYPELALREDIVAELVAAEFRHRHRHDPNHETDEYRQRFPDQASLIDRLMHEVVANTTTATPHEQNSHSLGDEHSLPPSPTPALAEYELLEVLGKGGMGAVYRSRDPGLGRDLALKVLRPELQGNREVEERFEQEARITGSLQHPGIVAVHALGRLPDGRLYFTMKIVRGRTLAEMLNVGPASSRPTEAEAAGWKPAPQELLAIFEKVCQTLAYAHSKRVIHRDLKPGNIMVGAFGEVQVMDWGLAKALPHDPVQPEQATTVPASAVVTGRDADAPMLSHAGNVMGTASYMAPEQAGGAVEQLDERCDVFGLGAVLCEMLTGQPPYTGPTPPVVLDRAKRAELGPAITRLESCGADAELVALAKRCLAVELANRPDNASEVARAVSAYMAGVQQRLRQAELERTAAEARVAEATKKVAAERKARRAVLGLAAAVLVVVALATAGVVYRQQQRRHARERAEEGLTQVAKLRDDYRYKDARDLLEHVRGWARQAADGELDAILQRAESELALASDLDDVRQKAATQVDGKWNPRRAVAEYPAVFAHHGLDVLEGDLDELADTVRASIVRESIVTALDNWAAWEIDPHRQKRLLRLANSADEPDPWRHAIRQALMTGRNEKALRQLAGETEKGRPTPSVVLLLASGLSKESQEPVALLRRMQLERPRDFWISYELGSGLYVQKEYREAARCWLLAVALRPDSAAAHINLGVALHKQGKMDDAIACFRKAIALDPNDAAAHNNLGVALQEQGKVAEAIACYRKAIDLDPKYAAGHYNLGIALKEQGKVDDAIACFRKAIALDPNDAADHTNLGIALHGKGKMDEAIASYRKAVDLDPKYAAGHYNLAIALQGQGKVDEAIACFRKATELEPRLPNAHGALGEALMQQGRFIEAQQSLRRCLGLLPPEDPLREFALNLIRQCRQHLAADGKLTAFLAGKGASADAIAQVEMAELAVQPFHRRNLTAARLYRDAFARKPPLADAHRYNAARAAALAGTGQGKDAATLDDRQRAFWRTQARDWLAAELSAHAARAKKAAGRPVVRQQLSHWLRDSDLAGVRDKAALDKLPDAERVLWQRLWADVHALLKRVER